MTYNLARMKKCIIKLFIVSTLSVFAVTGYVLFHYTDESAENADCAVVFGAAVWKGNIPSHALYDRIMTGVKLYKNKQVKCLVLSGGPSKYGDHEADVMEIIARQNEIPKSALEKDYNGINTQATIGNLDKERSYILVSNDFHLARISLFAWRDNLEFSLQQATYHYNRYMKESYFFLREVVGIFWYFKFEILFLVLVGFLGWGIVLRILRK